MEACKFFLQGYCAKGDMCIYLHSEVPCKYYHTGQKCFNAEKCKFSHEPLTDSTKPLLEKAILLEETGTFKAERPSLLGKMEWMLSFFLSHPIKQEHQVKQIGVVRSRDCCNNVCSVFFCMFKDIFVSEFMFSTNKVRVTGKIWAGSDIKTVRMIKLLEA